MKILTEMPPVAHKGEFVGMDLEMFGQELGKLHRPHGTFACISVNLERDPNTVYQLYDHTDLRTLFAAQKHGTWTFHNALYDLTQLRRFTPIKPRFIWDIMLVEQSLFGGYYTYFSLKDMARRWLDIVVDKETREHFSTAVEMSRDMKKYAADDVVNTLKIAIRQREQFSDTSRLDTYHQIDEPMIWPLLDIQGTRVDVGAWTDAVNGFAAQAAELETELGFNVYSPSQVKKALASAGIHVRSTGAETLKSYADRDIIKKLLETRMYRKAVSTYGLTWLEKFVESDGKVYPSWHITGASMTGRMSSSNPNGQNIPARKIPQYRTFFIPSAGNVMTIEDVTQQEPCILGYESQDPALLEAIAKGEDLHQAIADAIHQSRAIGKAINLGIGYGLTPQGLASRTGLDLEEATNIVNAYFGRFRGVFSWISAKRSFAHANGYVTTASGRRSHINPYDNQWQNNAINSPIQGGAADFTKMWVRKYWEACQNGLPYCLSLIVHDEAVKDVPKKALNETNEASAQAFQNTAETLFPNVPFRFGREVGKSWAAKSMKEELYEEDEEDEGNEPF